MVTSKRFSEWWKEEFHRTPGSGGLRWQKDNRVSGDIVPPTGSNFPFSVECKKHEGWSFEQIIKGTGDVFGWWTQCIRDASKVEKIPLLVFSKNRSPVYYMMLSKDWVKLPVLYSKRNWVVTLFETEDGAEHEVVIGFFDHLLEIPKDEVVKAFPIEV